MKQRLIDFLSTNWYLFIANFCIGISLALTFLKLTKQISASWLEVCLPIVILLILSIGLICYMGYILNKFDTLNDEW